MTAQYYVPTRLVHGRGALDQLPQLIGGLDVSHPLVVTDKNIAATPFLTNALERLARTGIRFSLFDQSEIDARLTHVDARAECVEDEGLDGVIGIGGGSVMCTPPRVSR